MKKNPKKSAVYFSFIAGLAGFKACINPQNGQSMWCPLQPVSQEQLHWK